MKRDIKYIIKRILIGVGIILTMSFINSCEVHAESSYWYDSIIMNKGFSEAYYYDFTANGNYNQVSLSNVPITNDYLNYAMYGAGGYGSNGKAFLFTPGQKLKKDYLYSVSLYVCNNSNFNSVTADIYAGVNANYIWSSIPTYHSVQPVYMSQNFSQNINTNYYITACEMFVAFVVPSVDSNYVAYKLKMSSGNPTESFYLGYNVNELGVFNESLLSQMQSIITSSGLASANSVAQVQQSISQVQQEVNGMQQKQDVTNQKLNDINDSINDSSVPSDSESKINAITDTIKANQNSYIVQIATFIPQTLQVILNGFNTSCTGGYSLGSLYGTELTIPCINPVNYLGSFLWGVIDSILCLCYLIPLCKFLVNKYNDLTSMKNLRWQ